SDLSWWQGTYNNTTGWLSRYYISLFGNCNNVPAVIPPASPTPSSVPSTPVPPQVTVTPGLPDLVVSDITGPTTPVLMNTTATFQITVLNIGGTAATNFHVGITLPDGTLQDLGVIPSLAPGQSAIFRPSILFDSPGAVRVTAVVD